jgi:hypothetical protein
MFLGLAGTVLGSYFPVFLCVVLVISWNPQFQQQEQPITIRLAAIFCGWFTAGCVAGYFLSVLPLLLLKRIWRNWRPFWLAFFAGWLAALVNLPSLWSGSSRALWLDIRLLNEHPMSALLVDAAAFQVLLFSTFCVIFVLTIRPRWLQAFHKM